MKYKQVQNNLLMGFIFTGLYLSLALKSYHIKPNCHSICWNEYKYLTAGGKCFGLKYWKYTNMTIWLWSTQATLTPAVDGLKL